MEAAPSAPAPAAATPPARPPRQRNATQMLRLLDASKTGRLESSWDANPASIGSVIYQDLATLVARSREQGENNDHAAKFLQMVKTNVIGPSGLILKSQVKDPSGKLDLVAQTAIETAWAEFGEIGTFDTSGTLSRLDVENLIATNVPLDGEFIAVKRFGAEFPHGFALQLIDPVLLDPKHFEKLSNGNSIQHGIEYSPAGRPVAYHFKEIDERQVHYIQSQRTVQRVPAENVIHIFLPVRVGQKRGLPWMRTALWRMKMLQGYEDAAITGRRTAAAAPMFFRDPEGEAPDDDEIPQELAEPGQIPFIGNLDLVARPQDNSSGEFDPFVKAMLRSIASGLNVPYNTLANDLEGVNFSSIRQGELDAREMWKGLQEWLIGQWSKKVFAEWLPIALLKGKITVPNKAGVARPLPAEKLDKYKPVAFRGRRWSWIDPNAEMKANELALGLNLKSRTEVIEDMGRDALDVWEEKAREDEQMKALGLDPVMPELLLNQPTPQDGKQKAA